MAKETETSDTGVATNDAYKEAVQALKHGNLRAAARRTAQAAGTLLVSPRAIASLFSLHTWRIIYTGQVLRRRAERVQE